MKLSKGKYEPGTYAIDIIRGKTNSFGQVQYKRAYLIIVTRIIIVEDDRSTNGYIGRVWLSRERITVPSIIVFFFFARLLSTQNFLEALFVRYGTHGQV